MFGVIQTLVIFLVPIVLLTRPRRSDDQITKSDKSFGTVLSVVCIVLNTVTVRSLKKHELVMINSCAGAAFLLVGFNPQQRNIPLLLSNSRRTGWYLMLWEHLTVEPLVTRHNLVKRRAMIQVAMCLPTAWPAPFSSFLEQVSGLLVRTQHVVLRYETSRLASSPPVGTCDNCHGNMSYSISVLRPQSLFGNDR